MSNISNFLEMNRNVIEEEKYSDMVFRLLNN